MYIKNTSQFNLLQALYGVEKRTLPGAETRSKGLYYLKFQVDINVVDTLEADGYLTKIQRDCIAIWITQKGIDAFKAYLDSIPLPPPPPPDLERNRALELRGKLKDKTITNEEKSELLEIVLKRVFI